MLFYVFFVLVAQDMCVLFCLQGKWRWWSDSHRFLMHQHFLACPQGRQHVGKTNRFLLTLSARYRNSLFGWTITICKRKHIIFHGGFSKKGVISLYANVYGYRLVWCSTIVDFSKIIQCPVDGVGGPLLWKMFFSDPFFQEELSPPLYTFLWVELVPLV